MRHLIEFLTGPSALRKRVLLALLVLLGIWLLFFDSHSVWQRIQWHAEYERLNAENQVLEERISRLTEDLEVVRADEVVEKVAREQYGMRRPGETVYRVEKE